MIVIGTSVIYGALMASPVFELVYGRRMKTASAETKI
jgi:hypothetical protein